MRKGIIDISGVVFMFVKVIYACSLEGHIGLLPDPIQCFLLPQRQPFLSYLTDYFYFSSISLNNILISLLLDFSVLSPTCWLPAVIITIQLFLTPDPQFHCTHGYIYVPSPSIFPMWLFKSSHKLIIIIYTVMMMQILLTAEPFYKFQVSLFPSHHFVFKFFVISNIYFANFLYQFFKFIYH